MILEYLLFYFPILIISIFFTIISKYLFERFSFGNDMLVGVQKIHSKKSSRLGSISILASIIISIFIFVNDYSQIIRIFFCIFPIYFIALCEDIFGNIKIITRFIASLISSTLFIIIFNSSVSNLDSFILNQLLSISIIAYSFTIIGLMATSNAWNFIDGVNGLSSGIAFFVLLTLSRLASDTELNELSIFLIIISISVLGFWVVNVVTGKIFLGDSGSYTLGMLIAWSGVEISSRNDKISSWTIFFLIIYPATEFIFSVIRRVFLKKSPFYADDLHLHSLIFKLLKQKFPDKTNNRLNSLCGLILMLIGSGPSIFLLIFEINIQSIIFSIITFGIIYVITYFLIFRSIKII